MHQLHPFRRGCQACLIVLMSSDNTPGFLPFDDALKIVGAIQEEEHLREPDRRIFTVYDKFDRELCWFDYVETVAAAAAEGIPGKKEELQPMVEKYVLNHIPDWVLD